jgi:hypothetical protein
MMDRQGLMQGMGQKQSDASICTMMTGHIEGHLAFLKAEIEITPEQESLWNDYANAVRGNAQALSSRCVSMMPEGKLNRASPTASMCMSNF